MDRALFVPKGLNDSSQAIYCLECVLKKTRPVGYGLSWSTRAFTAEGRGMFLPTPIISASAETVRFFPHPQAVNCQAIIIQSLRDKSHS